MTRNHIASQSVSIAITGESIPQIGMAIINLTVNHSHGNTLPSSPTDTAGW